MGLLDVFTWRSCVAFAVASVVLVSPTYTPLSALLNALDGTQNHTASNPFLLGNFKPIDDERCESNLPVLEGTIPPELDGVFVRQGPNPALPPRGKYHWFDGDGHLHAVRVSDGAAHYCNAYVRTPRLTAELRLGRAVYTKIGDMQSGLVGLLKILLETLWQQVGAVPALPFERSSVSNTNVIFFRDRVWALVEASLPLRVRIGPLGEIVSDEAHDSLGGQLEHCMTAHPKLDPRTGSLIFLCAYGGPSAPEVVPVIVREIGADGVLSPALPVTLPSANDGIGMPFMHEMAITRSAVVLFDHSLRVHPQQIVQRGRSIYWEPAASARFGLVPRSALGSTNGPESRVRWCDLGQPGHIFHIANAWDEEDGRVLVHGCWYDHFDPGYLDGSGSATKCAMATVELDPLAGSARLHRHAWSEPHEFPRINDAFMGEPNRYAYAARNDPGDGVGFDAVVKYDLRYRAVTARAPLGEGLLGGEASYVPAAGVDPLATSSPEDGGHVAVIVYDVAKNTSQFRLYNALDLSLSAAVQLPRRVPFGFHTAWFTGEQLASQA